MLSWIKQLYHTGLPQIIELLTYALSWLPLMLMLRFELLSLLHHTSAPVLTDSIWSLIPCSNMGDIIHLWTIDAASIGGRVRGLPQLCHGGRMWTILEINMVPNNNLITWPEIDIIVTCSQTVSYTSLCLHVFAHFYTLNEIETL